MFDEAKADLIDALEDKQAAITFEDAKDAISGGDLLAEQAINQHAEIEQENGTKYVVGVGDVTVDVPVDEPAEQTEPEGAETDAEPSEAETAQSASFSAASTESAAATPSQEFHEVGGITVDVDPWELLAGEPTGDEIMGARKLTNHHPAVPETSVPYYPVDLGERDTEDVFYRSLGLDLPIILEGEAGTGKNQLVAAAASSLNLPVYRQEFGADTSVMDVVGEKDLDGNSGTYYILGDAAKAAMFGGVYVADEINMAAGSVTSYLHPLFEEAGSRELQLRGTGRTLRDLPEDEEWDPQEHLGEYIHPDFYAVGTCNPLGYADTQEMNDALRSRCVVIEHPYLAGSESDTDGIELEAQLVADETGALPSKVKPLVRTAAVLREARRESNAPTCPIGHREIRDTVRLAGPEEEYMNFKSAAEIKMVGQASLKQDKQYIRDTIEDEL